MNISKINNYYIIDNLNLYEVIDYAEEYTEKPFEYFINAVDFLNNEYTKFKIHQFFIFELFVLLKYAKKYTEAITLYNHTHLKNLGKINHKIKKYDISKILKYEPKQYQLTFINQYPLMKSQLNLRGYYLAFDTGLGKSFTSFAVAFTYGTRLIVISPKSLKINWKNEILTFSNFTEDDICIFPEMNYTGQKILCTNYEQVKNIPNVFDKETFIVLDEAQQNRYADRIKIKELYNFIIRNNIDNILVLSGTPVKGKYGELSGAFLLIDRYFDEDVIDKFYKVYNKSIAIGSLLLKHRLSLSMLRLTKEKAGKFVNLPPKHIVIEPVILPNVNDYIISSEKIFEISRNCFNINNDFLKLLEKQELPIIRQILQKDQDFILRYKSKNFTYNDLILYKQIKKQYINKTQDKNNIKSIAYFNIDKSCLAKTIANNYINTLRNMILDIYNNKLEFIKKIFKIEKKLLIFTMYVDIAEELAKLFKENITDNVYIIHGGKSLEERAIAIKKFKEEDTILIATYGALGYGVTLVEGRIVIYADLPYREADLKQAVDRVYRIGQTRDVYVYYLKLQVNDETKITLQDKRERIIEKYADFVKELIDNEEFEFILKDIFTKINI